MGSRYLLGDFREGRVARAGIFEAVLRHRDGVRAAMPFAHQPSAWLQSKTRIWTYPARGPEHLRQCLELAAGRFTEPTVLKLLASIGDPAQEKIAADSWGARYGKAAAIRRGACQGWRLPGLRRGPATPSSVPNCVHCRELPRQNRSHSSLTSFEARIRALAPPQARNRSRAPGRAQRSGCLSASTTHASFAEEVQRKVSRNYSVRQVSRTSAIDWKADFPCSFEDVRS